MGAFNAYKGVTVLVLASDSELQGSRLLDES